MDFGIIAGVNPTDPSAGEPSYASFEPTRNAMGDTLHYAQAMILVEMKPRGDLSSTAYILANPSVEYLVLQLSETADPFTAELAPGGYVVEWYSVNSRETARNSNLAVAGPGLVRFHAPFESAGAAVLYLKRQ